MNKHVKDCTCFDCVTADGPRCKTHRGCHAPENHAGPRVGTRRLLGLFVRVCVRETRDALGAWIEGR